MTSLHVKTIQFVLDLGHSLFLLLQVRAAQGNVWLLRQVHACPCVRVVTSQAEFSDQGLLYVLAKRPEEVVVNYSGNVVDDPLEG